MLFDYELERPVPTIKEVASLQYHLKEIYKLTLDGVSDPELYKMAIEALAEEVNLPIIEQASFRVDNDKAGPV